ncbi:unnamed protein product, partial [Prorocentrum cordatum]
ARLQDGVATLNALGGRGEVWGPKVLPRAIQRQAVASLARAYYSVPPPPDDLTTSGAWSALLGCGSGCACDGVVAGEFATYQRGRLALPAVGNQAIDLVDCLPDHYQKLPEADEGDIAMDPILSRSPSKSAKFWNSAYESGVVEPAAEVRNFVGGIFARKKGGSLRIIFDPRKTNAQFVPPDGVALASPEALGDLELPVGAKLVHFQVRVVPMGWGWAAALVQAANAELLRSGPLGPRRWLCNRRCAPAVAGREPAALLCIDNFASLGAAKEAVQVDVDPLGFHVDWGKGAIRIAPRLIGHLTFVLLLRREMLILLSASYLFISKCYARRVRLWPSMRRELSWMRALLPLVWADLRGTWAPSVMAVVGRVGRVRESWRFKGRELVAEGSRARALREGAVGDSAFPDVPAAFCQSSLWKTVASRRWRHK